MNGTAPLAGLLALTLMTGCARSGPAAPAARTLHLGIENGITTLDPTYTEGTTFSVLSNVFEPLVDYDRQMRLIPALATAWTAPDDRTWLFTLRPGVTFHDGTPLTASLVAASLERSRTDPVSEVRARLAAVEAIDVPRDGEVRIRTSRPDALLLHELVNVLVAKGASRAEAEARPIGTGPYRVTRWQKGSSLELEAYAAHWRGAAPVPRASFAPLPTGAPAVAALKSGRVDVAIVPPKAVLERDRGFRIADSTGLTVYYLFLSTAPAAGPGNPLADRRVRQALSLAIDRRALARQAVGHEPAYAGQLVPPSVFGFAPALPPPVFDPAAARALLATVSKKPVAIPLAHREDGEAAALARHLASMLDAAGFQVTLRPVPWTTLLAEMEAQRLPLVVSRWLFDNGDAGTFLRDCVRSRRPGTTDGAFNAGISIPEMDRLIDETQAVFDAPLRLARFEAIMAMAREEVPMVPLFQQPDVWGVARDLAWEARLDGRLLVHEMAFKPDAGRGR